MRRRQRQIMEALEGKDGVCLRRLAEYNNQSDYKCIMASARLLEKKGELALFRLWTKARDGRATPMVWAFRPDVDPEELGHDLAETRYEKAVSGHAGVGECNVCGQTRELFTPHGKNHLCYNCWAQAGENFVAALERVSVSV